MTDTCHALFVSLNTEIGLKNPGVYLFASEAAAIGFACQSLIDAGELEYIAGELILEDGSESYDSERDAVERFNGALGASEYFHVYEVVDKR